MSTNKIQKKSQQKSQKKKSQPRSSTERRHSLIDYTNSFGLAMPVDCSRCKRLKLTDCKAADRSLSCQHCLEAGAKSCNIYGEPSSVLRGILAEKRRLDQEKEETLSKLLRLEAQSRALELKAGEAFSREYALLREEEAGEPAEAAASTVTRESEFPVAEVDRSPLSFGDADNLDFSGVDWSSLDPNLLSQVGLGSAGGTAGASPDSPGNRQVPTS